MKMNSSIDINRLFIIFSSISVSLLLIAVLTTGTVNAFENATEYKFVKKWGGAGSGDGQFLRPHDLDFNPDEKILYAVDRDGSRIQAFDKDGKFLFKFGEDGTGDGQMHVPYGIDVDKKGNIWLADRANDRVQEFDSKGKFILKFGNVDGVPSAEEGKFDNPRHVAVSKDLKYVYVADSKNNRISQFDKGNFFVNERGNERIQKFDSNWKPILMWGSKGSGDNQFCHIEHIALDKYDNVYVTDPQSDPGCSQQPRVLKFDNNGKFIIKFGNFGKGDGQFLDPEHLAVDSEGSVYISDRKRDDIQKFSPIGETSNNNVKMSTITNQSSQLDSPKKTNTNVLLDLAPKSSNATKTIDVKAWDQLMQQKSK
jgi:DNA-binding beta-propeller fold protein YncE